MAAWFMRGSTRVALIAVLAVAGIFLTSAQRASSEFPEQQGARASLSGEGKLRPSTGARALKEEWTARSRTWVADDGTRTTRIFQRQINAKDDQGNWKAIDSRLRRSGSSWTSDGGLYKASLPTSLDDAPIRMERDGAWITSQLRGADVTAEVEGETATFNAVSPGVTARWSAYASAIKEELILGSPAAASSFVFDVRLSAGLRLAEQPDGSVAAVDGSGHTAFLLSAPFAYDAGKQMAPKGAVRLNAKRAGGAWVVSLSLSRRWLEDEDRAFPVTVDPTTSTEPVQDCYLDQLNATTSYCTAGSIHVGHETHSTTHDHRGLLKFDLSALPAEANIIRGELWAYADDNVGSSAAAIDALRVTSAWTNDATWNKRNATTNWTTAGGDVAAQPEDDAAAPVEDEWSFWTISDAVRGWHEGDFANDGVLLRDDGTVANTGTTFLSSDFVDDDYWPYLEVKHYPRSGVNGDYTFDNHVINDRQTLKVNVAGGNGVLHARDLHIPGLGHDITVDRYYNAQEDGNGQVGRGWTLSVGGDMALYECDREGSRCLIEPDGHRAQFRKLPGGDFAKAPGIDATLVENLDGSFTLTWTDTGIEWAYGDDEWDYAETMTDPNGNVIEFVGPGDRLDEILDARNFDVDVFQNGSVDISRMEDDTGRQWDYGYDGNRNLTSVTDPDEHVTTYDYDGSGLLELITDARGNDILVEYDNDWRVTEVRREVDGGSGDVVTTYAYSGPSGPCGASGDVGKTVVTDPRGEDTTYCWNARGQVTSTHDPLGRETQKSYTSDLDPEAIVDFADTGNPATTAYDYNANEDLTEVAGPSGEEQSITYWPAGSNVNDPLRKFRVQTFTNPNGVDEFYDYDDNGNLTSVKDDASNPRNQATLAYNGDGTLDTFTDGEGQTTTFGYDADGHMTDVIPPTVTAPSTLGSTEYTYDALSRVETVTDGRGETLTYSYDGLDRITLIEAEDSSWISFAYDANGNLIAREDSGGNLTQYTYDKLNRLVEEDLPGLAYTQYGYDKNGNVTSTVDQSGTVTYGYDDVNRVTSIVSPKPGGGTDTVSYAYAEPNGTDAFTLRTATLPGSATQRIKKDLSGKITEILLKDSTTATLQQRTYDYTDGTAERTLVQELVDQAGNATEYTYADGVENVGRLLKARTETSGNALVTEWRYSYDKNGNRTKREKETSGGTVTETYKYNAANQLCWRYAGTSASACASPPGGATTFTYDAAGNQLTGENTLTWDRYGRLATIGRTSLGRLAHTNNVLSSFGSETFQDNAFGLSRHDDGTTVTSIVRDPLTGSPVSQTTGSTKRWYATDDLGSTIALTNDTGGQARSYAYDPDGTSTTSGSGPEAMVRFAGGHVVGNTGLYHFGARFYDPRVARWTSPDPLVQYTDLRQANRYGYASGDPVNARDPSGCASWWTKAKCVAQCSRFCSAGKLFACLPSCYGVAKCLACVGSSCGLPAARCMYFCLT